MPCFIARHFIVLHRCRAVYTLKAGNSTSRKIATHFTSILVPLWGSGTKPTVSLRSVSV